MTDFNGTYFYEATRRTRKHGERRGVVRRRSDVRLRHRLLMPAAVPEVFDLAEAANRLALALGNALAVPMQQAAEALIRIVNYMDEPEVEQSDRATPTALPIPRNSRADQNADFRREYFEGELTDGQ